MLKSGFKFIFTERCPHSAVNIINLHNVIENDKVTP